MAISIDDALSAAGTGNYQKRLLCIFGLVWAADAMQVLAIGFAAPTIAKEFGLTIPAAVQVGTAFFLGMLLGAWGFGWLADRIGRRNVLIATVLLDAGFGLLSAVAPNFTMLLILRFGTGVAVGGTLPVDYAMMAEFLPARNRGRWLVGLEAFWAVGTVALAVIGWLAASYAPDSAWRIIFAAAAMPAVIGFGLRFWVPESPYHLARTGLADAALDVINRIARTNGRPPIEQSVFAEVQPKSSQSALFQGDLARPSALILSVWFLLSVSYYGVFVWLPTQLANSGHGFVRGPAFLILLALAQLPGYALAAYGVERWGRRPTLILFLLLSAAGCFLYLMATTANSVAIAALLMSFALLGAWGGLYTFTPEIYPTRLRATGMGVAGAMARFGGLLAPSAVGFVMVQTSFETVIAMFAFLLAIGALATYAIKAETRGAPLT